MAYFHVLGLNVRCSVHEFLEVVVQVFEDEVQLSVTVEDLH